MSLLIDRATVLQSMENINSFFTKLNNIKHYYRWEVDDDGCVIGSYLYLNIHDVFDDCIVHKNTPLQAVAFPSIISDQRELIEFLDYTFEEGQIILAAIDNDVRSDYFIPQIRKNLLIELGVEENV